MNMPTAMATKPSVRRGVISGRAGGCWGPAMIISWGQCPEIAGRAGAGRHGRAWTVGWIERGPASR
jgi:hypothetical protein